MKMYIIGSVAAVAGMLFCYMQDAILLGNILKMAASCGFIATALVAGARSTGFGKFILVGLFFSWWGDLFLARGVEGYFLWGLITFFLAHLAYCAAYVLVGINRTRTLVALGLLAVPAVLLSRWIWPGVSADLRGPVLAYMALISVMVALAVGTTPRPGSAVILTGAVLFFVSDIFVARSAFVQEDMLNPLIGLPLYYGGQLFLAAAAAYAVQPETNPASAVAAK